MAERPKTTERDRYWLDHEAAIVASGLTAKAYASEQGVSLQALYQARKRLRSLGLMSPAGEATADKAKSRKRKNASFAKLEVLQREEPGRGIRLRLPNGVMLECSGLESPKAVAELVEQLVQIR
jgi:hypothetical protein